MRLVDFKAKTPLIGMSMVFLAMFVVAVTAYLHVGWYSILGYAVAAAVAVFGFIFTFRDMPAPPHGPNAAPDTGHGAGLEAGPTAEERRP